LLNEIVVVVSTLPDDSVQRVIDGVQDATAQLGRKPSIPALDGGNDDFVTEGRKSVGRTLSDATRNHPEQST
jgi:hypothetical protein